MPTPPNIDDLTDLSATGAMLECVLHDWVYEITQLTTPDIPTLAEAIDFFARLTAIRKTLIKLSRLEPPKPHASPSPSPAIPDSSTSPSDPETRDRRAPESPDPATLIFDQATQLPVPLLDPLPSIPCIPLDQLRPELENLSTALNHVCSEIFSENSTTLTTDDSPLDSDQLDDTPDSHISHSSHSSDSSDSPRHPYLPHRELSPADHPHPYDPRCIALNIHPRTGDTTKIPNKHPFFNRAHYGDFMKNAIMPWHRKKIPKRFG